MRTPSTAQVKTGKAPSKVPSKVPAKKPSAPQAKTRARSKTGSAATKRVAAKPAVAPEYRGSDLPHLSPTDVWTDDHGLRILLVDLDNLQSKPRRLEIRIRTLVEMARHADTVAFAGRRVSVERCLPYLEEFAAEALVVPSGRNQADLALLRAAKPHHDDTAQYVVASNDNIFARLAREGRLTVVSPRVSQLSGKLIDNVTAVVDLEQVEGEARKPRRAA